MNTVRPVDNHLAGPEIRGAAAEARQGLRRRRDPVAGARHRREHGDLPVARCRAFARRCRSTDPERAGQRVASRRGSSRSGRLLEPLAGSDLTRRSSEIRARQQVFSRLLARGAAARSTPRTGGEVKNVETLWASGDCFSVLGVNAAIGRVAHARRRSARLCLAGRGHQSRVLAARSLAARHRCCEQTVRLEGRAVSDRRRDRAALSSALEVGRRFDVAVPLCADLLLQNGVNRFESRREWWLAVGRPACARADAGNRPTIT